VGYVVDRLGLTIGAAENANERCHSANRPLKVEGELPILQGVGGAFGQQRYTASAGRALCRASIANVGIAATGGNRQLLFELSLNPARPLKVSKKRFSQLISVNGGRGRFGMLLTDLDSSLVRIKF
jgi:hypothetical protein